jgi:hypothetical protein
MQLPMRFQRLFSYVLFYLTSKIFRCFGCPTQGQGSSGHFYQLYVFSISILINIVTGGVIGDVGYVAERKELMDSFHLRGISPIPLSQALAALEHAIIHQVTQVNHLL